MNAPSVDLGNEPVDFEPLSKAWRFREHWSGEIATYRMGSVSADVRDMDGDRAVWEVRQHDEVIRSGSDPDFWDSVAAVEEVLVEIGWLYRPAEAAA